MKHNFHMEYWTELLVFCIRMHHNEIILSQPDVVNG